MTYIVALLCVIGISAGQILFKISAMSLKRTGSIWDPGTAFSLFAAFFTYCVMSIAWIWVLQRIGIGRIYPLMALAFVLVPLASHFIFNERFQPQYFIGVAVIMLGIFISMMDWTK